MDELHDISSIRTSIAVGRVDRSPNVQAGDRSCHCSQRFWSKFGNIWGTFVMKYEILKGWTSGFWKVKDWIYFGEDLLPLVSSEGREISGAEDSSYLLFVSGLNCAGEPSRTQVALQLLMDFLSGRLGGPMDMNFATKIARWWLAEELAMGALISKPLPRIIVAGDSISAGDSGTRDGRYNRVGWRRLFTGPNCLSCAQISVERPSDRYCIANQAGEKYSRRSAELVLTKCWLYSWTSCWVKASQTVILI